MPRPRGGVRFAVNRLSHRRHRPLVSLPAKDIRTERSCHRSGSATVHGLASGWSRVAR